jgi:NAD(P)-dependent dehydrogenase (short-subunit alcohol dehydrogenase family)
MANLNLDGQVAVVTGAGRGIGRGYALLLGELGAKVVVNDNGGATTGLGSDAGPASEVAQEIRDSGGIAVANTNDISTEDGGNGLIAQAVNEFGRIDIVVNNAGNVLWGGMPEVDAAKIEGQFSVHVMGSFHVTRAAWPYMLEQNYGRVVLTSSVGMFGLTDNLGYAIVKSGMLGMAKSMTVGAGEANIKVNVIAPNAWTRLGVHPSEEMQGMQRDAPPNMGTELVAPMVAYLCHESCEVSGEAYVAGAGRFARMFVGVTDGYVHAGPDTPTIDDVAKQIAAISDESSYYVPANLMDWAGHYMSHR